MIWGWPVLNWGMTFPCSWRPWRPQELKLLKPLELQKLLNPGASGRGFGRPLSLFQRPLEASGFKSFESFKSFKSFKSLNSWGLQEPSQRRLEAFWRPGRPQKLKLLKLWKLSKLLNPEASGSGFGRPLSLFQRPLEASGFKSFESFEGFKSFKSFKSFNSWGLQEPSQRPLEAFWRPGRPQELKLLKPLELQKLLNPGASGRGFGRPLSLFQRPLEASGFKSFESFESFKSFNSWGLQEPSQRPLDTFWRPGRPQELKLLKLLKLSKLLNPGASGRGFGRPLSLFQRPLEASGFKSFESFKSFKSFKSFNSWGLQEPSQRPLEAFWRPGRPQELKLLKLLKLSKLLNPGASGRGFGRPRSLFQRPLEASGFKSFESFESFKVLKV